MSVVGSILALTESDHDLLIQLNTKLDIVYTLLSNHLEHHFAYNIALFGALLSLSAGVVLWVVKSRKVQASSEKKEGVTDGTVE